MARMLPAMSDDCHLQVADKVIKDQRTVHILNKVHRDFVYTLSDNIIGGGARQEIQSATTDEKAIEIFRKNFMNSLEPTKMTVFLQQLREKQPLHAEKIEKVYQQYLIKHSCNSCDVATALTNEREVELHVQITEQKNNTFRVDLTPETEGGYNDDISKVKKQSLEGTLLISIQPVFNKTGCKQPKIEQDTVAISLYGSVKRKSTDCEIMSGKPKGQTTKKIRQDEENTTEGKNLRTVAIDGKNVAMEYGRQTSIDWKGVAVVMNHFLKHGHRVMAVIPRSAQQEVEDTPELSSLKDHIEYSPCRCVAGSTVQSGDDLLVLEVASKTGGVVVTNKGFGYQYQRYPQLRDVIANRLLPYRFVWKQLVIPRDPLGDKGPTLEQFLQQDTKLDSIQAEFERKMTPSEIGFTKKKIDDVFDNGELLKVTFIDILDIQKIHDKMPPIDCVKAPDGHYYAQDGNKRLFLLKMLEEEGQKLEIKVNIMLHDPSQFPSDPKQLELEDMNPGLYKSLKEIMRKQKDPVTPGDATQD